MASYFVAVRSSSGNSLSCIAPHSRPALPPSRLGPLVDQGQALSTNMSTTRSPASIRSASMAMSRRACESPITAIRGTPGLGVPKTHGRSGSALSGAAHRGCSNRSTPAPSTPGTITSSSFGFGQSFAFGSRASAPKHLGGWAISSAVTACFCSRSRETSVRGTTQRAVRTTAPTAAYTKVVRELASPKCRAWRTGSST